MSHSQKLFLKVLIFHYQYTLSLKMCPNLKGLNIFKNINTDNK